jgi:hypothetical protein
MAAEKTAQRKARLANALKQNLRRRKTKAPDASAEAAGHTDDSTTPGQALGRGAGVAPQAGLKPLPSQGPKTAPKRN